MNRNSGAIWFPPIEKELPVPKTVLVEYDHRKFVGVLEGETENNKYIQETLTKIETICEQIGYPCFLRSDLTSGKHSGPETYLARSKDTYGQVIFNTVEDNEMKLWPHSQPTHFMIREFLELNANFCAFGGLPIAREFRLFADSEKVYCVHPYWPEDSIEFYGVLGDNAASGWKETLKEHHRIPADIEEIKAMAVKACRLIGKDHRWSVDFAQDVDDKWWLIDMAHADDSYHWPECDKQNNQ